MSQPASKQSAVPEWRGMAWRAAGCAVAAVTGWILQGLGQSDASLACFLVAYVAGGWDLAKETWAEFREFEFTTHFLMLMVVPATAALGAWGEGALLLVLFSGSAALERYAMGRTRSAIDALLRGAPTTALVLRDGEAVDVPVEAVTPGMRLRVKPGQQVPVDLVVTDGESACDESSLTGESVPVSKRRGDTALAGTLNVQGVLEGTALRAARESTLQKMIGLIERAQHLRAPSQRLADAFGTRYTAFVLTACTGLFLWSWLGEHRPALRTAPEAPSAFYRAMTLLVVMSPCALVLSVPSAILSAIASGARRGVLFRGGAAVEKLARVTVVCLDKTGTLTEGQFRLQEVRPLRGEPAVLLERAATLARLSTHPVSRAVAREALARGLAEFAATDVTNLPGAGVRGLVEGRETWLGNRQLIFRDHPDEAADVPPPEDSMSEVWVRSDGMLGQFLLRDSLREEARPMLARLHAEGVRTVMLTGDRASAARLIGEASGVGEVRSGLKPEDKVAAIEEFKTEGVQVAMVGDGVNDAPCLAAADVGVAMGARGSDAAIEQADVVLMHDRLENFLVARDLSRRARTIIGQNLAISLGVMAVMALVTAFSARVLLAFGVAMHEGSTAVVVLNSLRLLLPPRRHAAAALPATADTRPSPASLPSLHQPQPAPPP
ncbi:MAG: heavy metal translocating P-type ATPase [Verrucomicrobiales bacterium]